MLIFYYCSYDGSPTGFHIGVIDDSIKQNKLQKLSEKKYKHSQFISNCLESGLVRSGFGRIPKTSSDETPAYFVLKKKLVNIINDCKYYMNIAIISWKWEEFYKLVSGDLSEEELASKISKSIIINKECFFGYDIDISMLHEITTLSFKNVCNITNSNWIKHIQENDVMYLTLSQKMSDLSILKDSLGLTSKEKGFGHIETESGIMVCYEKKSCASRILKIDFLLAIMVIILVLIILLQILL